MSRLGVVADVITPFPEYVASSLCPLEQLAREAAERFAYCGVV